jgi:HSP20 family molecular chaperone IbpA
MTTTATEVQARQHEQTRDLPVVNPATDIHELENQIVVVADLPGVRQDQVEITLENRVLTIRARSAMEEPPAHECVYREFGPAEFQRSFTLTEEINRDAITARMKNGVLRLVLPKAAEAQPRRIAVQAEG